MSKARGDHNLLVRQAAHDMRSPLTALNLLVETIAKEEQRDLFRQALRRIDEIADDLMDDSLDEYMTAGSLACLAAALLDSKRLEYKSLQHVKFEFHSALRQPDLAARIRSGDIKRILSNLINNSVEALSMDGGLIRVVVSGREHDLVLEVEDPGAGIPEEVMPKLGSGEITYGKKGGHGLGLSHAFRKIRSWGAKINIQSQPGRGTRILLQFPVAESGDRV